jgi:hypothetical protein
VLESAKDILRDTDYDIRDINFKIKGELLTNLFTIFTNEDSSLNSYLPNHKVIARFRDTLYDLLRESKTPPNDKDLPKILFEFNTLIEQKATQGNEELGEYHKWNRTGFYNELYCYLEQTRTDLEYEINPVDKKPWYAYYVKNRAVVRTKEYWGKNYAEDDKKGWDFENFLKDENKKIWYTIIGAPFGIGKTSLAKYIAIHCAKKYLETADPSNDVPIFVRLKDGLTKAYGLRD